jgi:hypothetical protein
MIIVLAGRRIDAPDAETPRFPLERVEAVAEKIEREFARLKADTLICSAACGADLIALQIAKNRGMRRRIVLPFVPTLFREKSVTDRPGNKKWNWGKLFDELSEEVRGSSELVIAERGEGDDTAAYKKANERIFKEAAALLGTAGEETAAGGTAIVVWEGGPRGEDDLTMEFAERAKAAGYKVIPVLTN